MEGLLLDLLRKNYRNWRNQVMVKRTRRGTSESKWGDRENGDGRWSRGLLKVNLLQETEWSQVSVWGFRCCCEIHTTIFSWQRGWWDVLKVLEHTCRANSQPLIHYCHSVQAKRKSFPTTGLCITCKVQSYQSAFLSLRYTFPLRQEHIYIAARLDQSSEGAVWIPRFISQFFLTGWVKKSFSFHREGAKSFDLPHKVKD